MPSKKAYKVLSLADHNKIPQQSASGKSQRRLATDFGVSLGTINNTTTLKRKQEIMDATAGNVDQKRKRIKIGGNEEYFNMEDNKGTMEDTHQGTTNDSCERDLTPNDTTAPNETEDTETEPKEDASVPRKEYKTSEIINALDVLKEYTWTKSSLGIDIYMYEQFLLLEEDILSAIVSAKIAKLKTLTTMEDFFKQK